MLFGIVLGLKKAKKHSLGHSEAGAQNCSKSTLWGTFRPAPRSTPVHGGRDRKNYMCLSGCPVRCPVVSRTLSGAFAIGAKIITHTTFIADELILQLHTHQLHNFNCRGLIHVMRVYLWCLFALPRLYTERQLHKGMRRSSFQ